MKFRTKENISTAAQLTKKRTSKDVRHESMLQYTDNQAATKLTLRAKEQQMNATTLLRDKDYNCIITGFVCSTAYKGQSGRCHRKPFFKLLSTLPDELLKLKVPLLHVCLRLDCTF